MFVERNDSSTREYVMDGGENLYRIQEPSHTHVLCTGAAW